MFFQHIFERGLAQSSYFIGCQATREALVIDPKRDIDTYLEIAQKEKMKITHVTETHIHADFLSGARELAHATGAELMLSDEGGPDWLYQYPHTGLKDGQIFSVGNLKIQVMHSPGHTPEHISFLLTDVPAGDVPVMIFTGDFVFVGDVGRPDLLEKAAGIKGTMEKGARQMFQSLKKFKALPDFIQVWPGHGAGSACGKALGSVPASTIGYQKLTNWALRYSDENEFVKNLLEGQPEPPKYFAMMKHLNKTGAPILNKISKPKKLSAKEVKAALQEGVMLIDTRPKKIFAEEHIPGAINIMDNSAFSTWAGWLLNYDKPFMLVSSEARIEEIQKALIRIGLDHALGYIPGMAEWLADAGPVDKLEQISASELKALIDRNEVFTLDIRAETEYFSGHLPNAVHIHGGYLPDRLDTLPTDKKIVVQCQGGDRSAIAASLLRSKGFKHVINFTGGLDEWQSAGYPLVV